jgi:hypothetical protein
MAWPRQVLVRNSQRSIDAVLAVWCSPALNSLKLTEKWNTVEIVLRPLALDKTINFSDL